MAISAHFAIMRAASACPHLPYRRIKDDILGARYELSLVFIGPRRAQMLNRTYRKKTYVPSVLSFPLDEAHGEIFITPAVAHREARARGMTARGYVGLLFIHAALHLNGVPHGATMETTEKQYCKKYRLA